MLGLKKSIYAALIISIICFRTDLVGAVETETYKINEFILEYGKKAKEMPAKEELKSIGLNLGFDEDKGVLMKPQLGKQQVFFSIGQIPSGSRFSSSGLRSIFNQIAEYFYDLGYLYEGVTVLPDTEQIDLDAGVDRRAEDDLSLKLTIWIGPVEKPPEASPDTEATQTISRFTLQYGIAHPELPPLEDLYSLGITLGFDEGALVKPENGKEGVYFPLKAIPPNAQFTKNGLLSIFEQIVAYFNDLGYFGVFVTADDKNTDNGIKDEEALTLNIWVSQIEKVRTIGQSSRYQKSKNAGIDHGHHLSIAEKSPFKGPKETLSQDPKKASGSLLRKNVLERYVTQLNRYNGRQVNISLSPSGETGKVILDYLVNESKPWVVYSQLSNTGTDSTGHWRARVGGVHYQLTRSDDILSADYIHSDTSASRAALASYERPLFLKRLRGRLYGSWSQYEASELGLSNLGFKGRTRTAGTELAFNFLNYGSFSLDALTGLRWERLFVDNQTIDESADVDLAIGYLGLSFERRNQLAGLQASVTLEHDFHNLDSEEIVLLGRLDTDDNWTRLLFDASQSVYLEPLIFRKAWRDPVSWRRSTLAHELSFNLRGQQAFHDERLIPQQQFVAGGFFSVRGYPESATSGDNGYVLNSEYRLHLPRLLKPADLARKEPLLGRYNLRPPTLLARPDWDFIIRAFYDIGSVSNNRRRFDEADFDLESVGAGAELQLLNAWKFRMDYGYILETLEREGVILDDSSEGESRLHFLGTFSW